MPGIHHELIIATPAERIYHAITTSEGLAGWWSPDASATPSLDSVARIPFGPNYFKEMRIVDLTPFTRVGWKCVAGTGEWVGTTLSFQLHTGDKNSLLEAHPEILGQVQQQKDFEVGTLLIFHHDDWREDTPMLAECNYTWGQFLRSLKLFCETGKGRPWPNQHTVAL
jgi:uncharacterized protein YndB with AHSA1/START domain